MPNIATLGDMLEHCPQLEFLRIYYDGYKHSGYGMGDLVKALNNLPVLESVQFYKVPLYRRDGVLLYRHLIKKKSVRSILMVDT
jgi:hypothetical protein